MNSRRRITFALVALIALVVVGWIVREADAAVPARSAVVRSAMQSDTGRAGPWYPVDPVFHE